MIQWCVIFNPKANGSKAAKFKTQIQSAFELNSISYEWCETTYAGHAKLMAQHAIESGIYKILVCGGDGTLNEVVNGIMLQKKTETNLISLAVFPIGNGNDWARTHQLTNKKSELVRLLKYGTTAQHDLGKITFQNQEIAYFINVAGIGFDGLAAQVANEAKELGKSSKFTYILSLIKALKLFKPEKAQIKWDNQQWNGDLFTCIAGIGKYAGNGMKLVPDALFYDGKLDITLVEKISNWKIIINFKNLFSGRFFHNKEVRGFRTNSIEINANGLISQVDGEVKQSNYLKIECLPAALQVLVIR